MTLNRKRLNTVKLQELETREHIWQGAQRAYTETAKDVLGYSDDIQKPWMSKNSWKLIDERKAV